MKIGGAPGWLARDNAQRNPQRTASTAAALMIGLALVTLVGVLAAGIVASFKGAVERLWQNADYAITAQNNFSPIPIAAADAVAQTPGVIAVGNVRTGETRVFDKNIFATAVDPAAKEMFSLNWTQGSQDVLANARSRWGVRRQRLREGSQSSGRFTDPDDVPERCHGRLRHQRHLRPAGRRVTRSVR